MKINVEFEFVVYETSRPNTGVIITFHVTLDNGREIIYKEESSNFHVKCSWSPEDVSEQKKDKIRNYLLSEKVFNFTLDKKEEFLMSFSGSKSICHEFKGEIR